MRLLGLHLHGHRSVDYMEFEAGPFTVLFGKNNAGKTNILETIHGIFAPADARPVRQTHAGRPSRPEGGLYAELEIGLTFDDAVQSSLATQPSSKATRVTFTRTGTVAGSAEAFTDDETGVFDFRDAVSSCQSPRPHVLFLDWEFTGLHERVAESIAGSATTDAQRLRGDWPWLEMIKTTEEPYAYRVPPKTKERVEQLGALATDLLPDFVDGAIRAGVTGATLWGSTPKLLLEYEQRGLTQCADLVDAAGHGAARWMAAAVQIALHLMSDHPGVRTLRDLGRREFSGHVLLVDEPEAHLHPSAVASMVRWCHRMVSHGFTVVVASHHEEFLRAAGDDVTLVHVTRDPDLVNTSARTLPSATTQRLQELASDIGLHPASALSLHRAVLFVEGPLDEAELDEFGSLHLDAAGVKIIPIHGTKNLEGLVSAELVTQLGIRMAILTDAPDPSTMAARSGNKRSSEERKVMRVLQLAAAKGLPAPEVFGVAEDDLLFALPVNAIRAYLQGPFPEWKDLVAECRAALGKGPSDSVDWKSYAEATYGLPITTPAGVRDVVRKLDLAGVPLPSLRAVVDQVVAWANRGSDWRPTEA